MKALRWPLTSLAVAAALAGCALIPRDVPPSAGGQPAGVLDRFGREQAALSALAALAARDGGIARSYDFARAQCFVQHAYSEQHENDRSAFVDAALTQAEGIGAALQASRAGPATQLINHSQRMRPDLWAAAERHRGNRCAQATAGCLEVQLVRAGHEHHTLGWRHSTSYFAIAEDMAAQAAQEAAACSPPPPPAPPAAVPASPPPPPAPLVPVLQRQALTLGADVLFKFDRSAAGEVLEAGRRQLDDAAAKLKSVELQSVRVIGYTDPQGAAAYNDKLSQRRADTVKALLVQRGVPAEKVSTEGRGERDPVVAGCDRRKPKQREALNACNQPNRRVVIEFSYFERR